ncbi:MAG: hypothetical protein ACLR2G_06890 [Phascolarctobacterium faecium]
MRANMIWIFAIGSFCTLGSFCCGYISGWKFDCFVAVCVAGSTFRLVAGRKMFFRINQHLLKRIALLVVLIGGVMTLGSGINGVLH